MSHRNLRFGGITVAAANVQMSKQTRCPIKTFRPKHTAPNPELGKLCGCCEEGDSKVTAFRRNLLHSQEVSAEAARLPRVLRLLLSCSRFLKDLQALKVQAPKYDGTRCQKMIWDLVPPYLRNWNVFYAAKTERGRERERDRYSYTYIYIYTYIYV